MAPQPLLVQLFFFHFHAGYIKYFVKQKVDALHRRWETLPDIFHRLLFKPFEKYIGYYHKL